MCADHLSIFSMSDNAPHQLATFSGQSMRLVMLDKHKLVVRFESCVTDSKRWRDGFSIDITKTGMK